MIATDVSTKVQNFLILPQRSPACINDTADPKPQSPSFIQTQLTLELTITTIARPRLLALNTMSSRITLN